MRISCAWCAMTIAARARGGYTGIVSRKLLFLAMIFVAGCAGDSPSSPTSTELDGVWRIISIQPATQSVQLAPVGVLYQVTFDDGRTSVRVDCNVCTGRFTSDRNTLTVGPQLACTRAACETASYENAVLTLLSGDHQYTTTLHNLTLTSSRGTVLLQR
jgi:heat shock protein HslJ